MGHPSGAYFISAREFLPVSHFRETYRGSVAAWECDQYGHMNVQFYTARISDAAASVMLAAGFAGLLLYDLLVARKGGAPPRYAALRWPLGLIVIGCLLLGAFAAGQ